MIVAIHSPDADLAKPTIGSIGCASGPILTEVMQATPGPAPTLSHWPSDREISGRLFRSQTRGDAA